MDLPDAENRLKILRIFLSQEHLNFSLINLPMQLRDTLVVI